MTTDFLPVLLVCILIVAGVGYVMYKKMTRLRDVGTRVNILLQNPTKMTVTPAGVRVFWENLKERSREQELALDLGVIKCIEKGRCQGYTNWLDPAQSTICMLSGTEVDSQGDPCFKSPPGQYAGSEWDKGGYILVAGQTLERPEWPIALPVHPPSKLAHLALIAEYETEHAILGNNDAELYMETRTHGQGKGHPVIPDCPLGTVLT